MIFFFGGAIVLKSGFVVICIVRTKNHPFRGIIYGSSGSSLIDRQFTYKKEKRESTLYNEKLKQLISRITVYIK